MIMRNEIRSMNRIQVRMLLEFMGIPVAQQDSSIRKCKLMLGGIAENDFANFNIFYNIVMHKKLPDSGSENPITEEERLRSVRLIQNHVEHLETNTFSAVETKLERMLEKDREWFTGTAMKIIEDAKSQFVTHQIKIGNKKPKTLKDKPPKQFKKLLDLASARKNILMVGPSGCGKTHVAAMIAEALDMEYSAQSCSVGVSESSFVGWLLPTGTNGQFNHVVSSFLRLYENGGVFLVDEMDNADPNLLVFLNMALANKKFYLPQRFDNPEVVRHPDFICVAAANTFGGGADQLYTSRNALDAATLDRFRIGTIEMDYDDDVEEHLIKNEVVLRWARLIRHLIAEKGLAKLMSTRAMIDAQDMINDHDWTIADCTKSYFADWSPEEKAMVRTEMKNFLSQVNSVQSVEAA